MQQSSLTIQPMIPKWQRRKISLGPNFPHTFLLRIKNIMKALSLTFCSVAKLRKNLLEPYFLPKYLVSNRKWMRQHKTNTTPSFYYSQIWRSALVSAIISNKSTSCRIFQFPAKSILVNSYFLTNQFCSLVF